MAAGKVSQPSDATPEPPTAIPDYGPSWRRGLARFFERPAVEGIIGLLIVASVAMTLIEFAWAANLPEDAPLPEALSWLDAANSVVTWIFIAELTLRYFAVWNTVRFAREYWIDILAVIPVFRIFRAARAIRLLRLLRLLRVMGLVSRAATHFPEVFRRGAIEYLTVTGLLLLTVVFGTGALMFFEAGAEEPVVAKAPPGGGDGQRSRRGGDEAFDMTNSFWFSLYTLFAGEPIPVPPKTIGGKITTVFIMFMGLTIFAMFTGTVSAFMVEGLRREEYEVDARDLVDHVVLCGWNSKAEIIAKELLVGVGDDGARMVAVAQFAGEYPQLDGSLSRHLMFIDDDFTRVPALERAGIHAAKTCIILSDTSGGRSEQDADARTIMAALTVEKLSPAVYTCAELHNRVYGTHLELGHVNDYVVAGEHSAYLLAHAAMNRGLMSVVTELLTFERGNQFYRMPAPAAWEGRPYAEAFLELKQEYNAVLIGVYRAGEEITVNPAEHQFAAGDDIVLIADRDLRNEIVES